MTDLPGTSSETDAASDRREFLARCGRFAIVTPPAVTLLLSTSLTSEAIAKSGGAAGNPGHGGTPPGQGGTPPGQIKKSGGLLDGLF